MKSVKVIMPDGVGLQADIYLPEGKGPFPVVLIRTAHGRQLATYGRSHQEELEIWLERGYAYIIQDTRGTGDSEGEFQAFLSDGWGPLYSDGAHTIEWVKSQEWCNGKVGTYGGSALGVSQVLLAGATKSIDAQAIIFAASDLYSTLAYPGGVLRKSVWEAWMPNKGEHGVIALNNYKAHPAKDAFWRNYDIETRASDITAPAIHIGGWWDIFQTGTIRNFMSRQNHGGAGAYGNQALIMAPCTHTMNNDHDYKNKIDSDELNDWFKQESIKFLDYWLKGEGFCASKLRPVYYYVIGDDTDPNAPGNLWRAADKWPPCPEYNMELFLTPDCMLCPVDTFEDNGSLSFEYDPNNPFPTYGGGNVVLPSGPFDQRPVNEGQIDLSRYKNDMLSFDYSYFITPEGWEKNNGKKRQDLLKFATQPLSEPFEVTGPVKVRLYISSSAPDTDFAAKLVDIYPEGDGRELLLIDGIQRVKHRNSFCLPYPMLTPDEIVEIEIDIGHISCIFNKGHKIGLQISSSNYPRFEKNPNTGEDFDINNRCVIAKNTVFFGKKNPSALVLTVGRG